jgi:hypothetical protein
MFILFVVAISVASCYRKVYPDKKLAIDPKFLSLFNAVIKKDTIRFNGSNGNSKTFIITKVDSIISNRKGLLINERPYKVLRTYLKEIGTDTTALERANEIEVAKDPELLVSGITIHFNNLYFSDTILPRINYDTLNFNNKRFTNYYLFETSLGLKNPDDVKVLYISVPKGFLGFKTLSGEVWVNEAK